MVVSFSVWGYSIGSWSSTRPILCFFSLLLTFPASVFAGSGLISLACPNWRDDELLEVFLLIFNHQAEYAPLYKDASLPMVFTNKPSASDPTRLNLIF